MNSVLLILHHVLVAHARVAQLHLVVDVTGDLSPNADHLTLRSRRGQ